MSRSIAAPQTTPHNLLVLLATSCIPLALVLATEVLKDRRALTSVQSRKFLHVLTGPAFVATWPLYSSAASARLVAALLPGLMALRFALAGLGVTREPRLVAGTARSGQRQELLRGPLLYGVAHVLLTAAFWRQHPAGVVGVAALCLGDGLADVAGRRWGRAVLPHNKSKTWVGSAACVLGTAGGGLLLVSYLRWCGLLMLQQQQEQHEGPWAIALGCLLCGLAAAAVESLPLPDIDNVLVPAAAAGVALWWFGGGGVGFVAPLAASLVV